MNAAEAAQSRFAPGLIAYLEKASDRLVKDNKAATHYPCYQKHFVKTKEAISNSFQGLNNTTALILGVGGAQDIDLKALARTFEKIRLVDINLSQTKKALAEQVPEEDLRAKFELEEADLTGIFPELSTEAEKLAEQEDLTYNEFVVRILDLLPTLKPAAFPYKLAESSFVCSSLVSTQLVGTLIHYLNKLTKKTYGKTFSPPKNRIDEFDSFLASVIVAHLHELSVLVSPSGGIYYADHFTIKGVVHINHPKNPEIEDVVQVLGKNDFPFTTTLAEQVQKIFTVVSQQKWGWALPIKRSTGTAKMTNDDETVQKIPIEATEFREYQVRSYVLKRLEVTEYSGGQKLDTPVEKIS